MTVYSYKDVVDALNAAGFVEMKNNGGSHQYFENRRIAMSQTVPKHGKNLASGTAESILEFAYFAAYVQGIDLTDKKYKLNSNVVNYINKMAKRSSQNIMFLIPELVRRLNRISTVQDANNYIKSFANNLKSYNQNRNLGVGKE